ncbi:MAG TPA: flagellar basal-body rod protein FlgG [Spirochaetota bacterium]|nr:MAG: Flagellar basal-body rod protein FlgG [Spirochaetes bacterium ADurb.Bin133]HNZ27020.1 flagellar basal-body rod protein FlgG [Spirochaetota bacterium]HOF01786.1 flagellar basal-body rod protein FlgG [Spirochaetota bacterium]HOS33488.1 flagellar basal-body rod protein FlgG [Spirochaetota bacterium]HOS56642.1 flagellar basal-body rod protein FlgG [Spirochaetota bacterium]
MVRSLWTAASGMIGQQFNIDTISHNLSNVNTTGYKKTRAEFEDLLYQNLRMAGTPSTSISNYPTGIHVGLGVKTASTQKMFFQGSLQNSNNPKDLAIEGEGFFKVQMYDGTYSYTRDGAWKIDSNGQMVNHNGYFMEPNIIFPEGFLHESIAISKDGLVTCKTGESDEIIEVGRINLYRFVNPAGLTNIGENLYKASEASGEEIEGIPAFEGMGKLHQGFIEMSNVQVVEEMVNMIVAQRAYDLNSKAIQTSDAMLNTAVNLKR